MSARQVKLARHERKYPCSNCIGRCKCTSRKLSACADALVSAFVGPKVVRSEEEAHSYAQALSAIGVTGQLVARIEPRGDVLWQVSTWPGLWRLEVMPLEGEDDDDVDEQEGACGKEDISNVQAEAGRAAIAVWNGAPKVAPKSLLGLRSLCHLKMVCSESGLVDLLVEVLRTSSSLESLDLGGSEGLQDEGLSKLSPIFGQVDSLKEINLCRCGLKDQGIQDFSQVMLENSTLLTLNLSANAIKEQGATALGRLLAYNPGLKKLKMVWCLATGSSSATQALCAGLFRNQALEELWLDNNDEIGDNGALELGKMLTLNKTLKRLGLSNCSIGSTGAAGLSKGLASNTSLRELQLEGNPLISDAGANALGEALLHNAALKILGLENCGVGDPGSSKIGLVIAKSGNLTNLLLSRNERLDSGVVDLLTEGNYVQTLQLSGCCISSHSVQALANRMRGPMYPSIVLRFLDLSGSDVGSIAAMKTLGDMLAQNTTLQNLSLDSCNISETHIAPLIEGLALNNTLQQLILSSNDSIKDDGARDFGQMFQNGSSLRELDLRFCGILELGMRSLFCALDGNKSLVRLDVSHNNCILDHPASEQIQSTPASDKMVSMPGHGSNYLQVAALSWCGLSSGLVKSIANSLVPTLTLRTLDLAGNSVGEEGVRAIANLIGLNACLRELFLSDANINVAGGKLLAKELSQNCSLRVLGLARNYEIGTSGAGALMQSLIPNTVLCAIDLSSNRLPEDCVKLLGPVLEQNRTLRSLEIYDNQPLTFPTISSLGAALNNNVALEELYLASRGPLSRRNLQRDDSQDDDDDDDDDDESDEDLDVPPPQHQTVRSLREVLTPARRHMVF